MTQPIASAEEEPRGTGGGPPAADVAGVGDGRDQIRRLSSFSLSSMAGPGDTECTDRRQSSSAISIGPRRPSLISPVGLRASLLRLDSSHRLSATCCGSDLGHLYLPGIGDSHFDGSGGGSGREEVNHTLRRGSRRQGGYQYLRIGSYARFLEGGFMSEIDEEGSEDEETLLIEEVDESECKNGRQYLSEAAAPLVNLARFNRRFRRKALSLAISLAPIAIPFLMVLDMILGVSLSLYDSHLLREVPGFAFPTCYALVQKLTNALASLALIRLTGLVEATSALEGDGGTEEKIKQSLSVQSFRKNLVPLTFVALAQSISAALANRALQYVPLSLFKVCLMCGPIFVALATFVSGGGAYSRGRTAALGLMGAGAVRALYAEAGRAEDPRLIMRGAGFALGASAFSGIGLVLSSALMAGEEGRELNPLSLLFYLSCQQVVILGVYLLQQDSGESNELSAFVTYVNSDPRSAVYRLAFGSAMSLSLAVLTFVLVRRTSPVATSLLGNARSIATVAVASMLFNRGNVAGGRMAERGISAAYGFGFLGPAGLGYTLALMGGAGYALAALCRDGT